jgi:Xaa-Pro aminopeptidase
MDCGCSVGGYESDISRTFVFGEPTKRQRRSGTRSKGQQIAFEAAQVGTEAGSVDAPFAPITTRWAGARATSCRACRTAPATASAWTATSR